MTLKDLITITETKLEIGVDINGDFYASLEPVEVMENGCLTTVSGRGVSISIAVSNLCDRISNKRIAKGAFTNERREYNVPVVHP